MEIENQAKKVEEEKKTEEKNTCAFCPFGVLFFSLCPYCSCALCEAHFVQHSDFCIQKKQICSFCEKEASFFCLNCTDFHCETHLSLFHLSKFKKDHVFCLVGEELLRKTDPFNAVENEKTLNSLYKITNSMEIEEKNLSDYTSKQKKEFVSKFNKLESFWTMRRKKCDRLYEDFQTGRRKGVFLLKSTPGSGKSYFADLFLYYLNEVHKIKAYYFILPKNLQDLENKLKNKCGYDSNELIYYSGKPFFIIIDETQSLYKEYDKFWDNVKAIGDRNPNVKVLCFASYGSVRAIESRSFGTPMCFLENNTNGFEFFKFDKDEFNEIIESFKEKIPVDDKEYFEINSELADLIYQQSASHPELTTATLRFLVNRVHNMKHEERDFLNISSLLFSLDYMRTISGTKTCPKFAQEDLSIPQIEIIKSIHLHNGVPTFMYATGNFKNLEELEKFGIITQDFKNQKYVFVSKVLGSIIFSMLFDIPQQNSYIENPEKLDKKEIIQRALQGMNKDNFILVNQFKELNSKNKTEKTLSEDQWVCEFFRSLRALLDSKSYFIVCQAGSEVGCEGEVDLYVNGKLQLAIEITREGSDVSEHLGRLYRNYHFPIGSIYYVIDFRGKNFREMNIIQKINYHMI